MQLYCLKSAPASATHTKDGQLFRITSSDGVFSTKAPTEAESVDAFAASLGLVAYTHVSRDLLAPSVPNAIANWRAKAVLSLAGILPSVEAVLKALPDPDKTVALAAWNGGADLYRNGPTVAAAIAALKLTEAQVDALFLQAAALKV